MPLHFKFPLILLIGGSLASCSNPSAVSPSTTGERGAVTTSPTPSSAPATSTTAAACTDAETVVAAKIAATNERDWDQWAALHTAGVERTAPDLDEPLLGPAALRDAIERLVGSMPDYRLSLVGVVNGDGAFAATIHASGTMTEPLLTSDGGEIPGTGQNFEQDWVAVGRLECGLIAEWHEFYDQYDLLVQLGFMEPLF